VRSAPPLKRPHAFGAGQRRWGFLSHRRQMLASHSALAVGPSQRPRSSHGARRLAHGYPNDRTPSSPSVSRLAPTAEPEACYGPSLPFTLTAISRRASPVGDARLNRTRARAIAFWLMPFTMTTQFSVPRFRRNARFPERHPPSLAWPPFRTPPSAVCSVRAPGRRSKPGPRRLAPVDHF
jgi:hypothetical protein